MKILHSSFERYFVRKDDYVAFKHKQSDCAVVTMPLVMTQSLHANKEFECITLRDAEKANSVISLTRSFERRLLSAFNKKIIAGDFSIAKKALCLSSGLKTGSSLEMMLHILIQRRRENRFIDRHFKHIEPYQNVGEVIDIDKVKLQPVKEDEVGTDIFRIRLKSTEQLNLNQKLVKRLEDLSEEEIELMMTYRSMF